MTASADALGRLLAPRSLAIVGASDKPMSAGANVLANLEAFGFPGELHLVSRSRDRIGDRPCVGSVAELPEGLDAAILIVPAVAVRDTVAALAERRVGGAVVFASGFGETGEEGRRVQDEIAGIAAEASMALLGPNCLGFTNFAAQAPLTFERVQPHGRSGRGVAIVAQSGAMVGNIRQALVARGLPVSHAISTGNEAVVSATDVLSALQDEPSVGTFAVFVEQIREPRAFLAFADAAWASGRSIVLMHPGRSARSREAALSHTGAMAGDHAVMQAVTRAYGVSVIDTFDELFDVVALRHRFPRAEVRGLGVMTNSGAVRGVALDFCETLGLDLPRLREQTLAGLGDVLPDFAELDNPLDITAQGMIQPEIFGGSAERMLADPGLDGLLIAAMGGNPQQVAAKWDSLKPVLAASDKPVALTFLGDANPLPESFLSDISGTGVPFFRSPERALRAFAHLRDVARAPGVSLPEPVEKQSRLVSEYEGKSRLREAGIAVPEGVLATDSATARQAARDLGGRLVLKVQSAQIPHKSDVGGIRVGLAPEDDIEGAFGDLVGAARGAVRGAQIDGVLVERMVPGIRLEMVLSARRDPDWGVTLVVGLGGIWTEVFGDVRLVPAGLGRERLADELRRLRAASLFEGARGADPIDPGPVLDTLLALERLMSADPSLAEVEINPLAVTSEGAVALDALVSVR